MRPPPPPHHPGSGADVLELEDTGIASLTLLPLVRARRLARLLQQSVALYDAVATRCMQPRLSEIELRLWLVGQGCSAGEAGRVLKLMRSLVVAGGSSSRGSGSSSSVGACWVTAWHWVVGWQWVTHALEVYGVDWRGAAGLV